MVDRPDLGTIDRESVVEQWVQPAAAALVSMAAGFVLVGAILLVQESIVLGSSPSRILALGTMYLLPHIVAGIWFGRRSDPIPQAALAAGLAPVLLLLIALGAFGGPIATPFRAPVVTVAAVVVWSIAFGLGMLLGVQTRGKLRRGRITGRLRDA